VSTFLAAPQSPYKGLAAFEDSDLDALMFFGRERESEVIAANLMAARITVLYGPSGVGKSSILRAGVAHRLRQEQEVDVVVFSTWTGDPVAGLIEALGGDGESLVDDLIEAAGRAGGDLYLILDQFEEYFLYHPRGGEFAQQLAELMRRPGVRVNVLIGMREDALARLDAMKAAIPNLLANRLRLELLDRGAGRAAILGPISRYNGLVPEEDAVEVEPDLVDDILDEVTTGRVELSVAGRGVATASIDENRIEAPYLQLVLARLWEVETERGSRTLRRATLRELGGAERIVQDHLERAMAALSPREKGAAAAMYNFLVTPSGTKIAHGVRDLAGYAALEEGEAIEVLRRLSAERIVRASSENGPSTTRYEIFHDVLADAVLGWRARFESERHLDEERAEHERRQRRLVTIGSAALLGVAVMAAVAIYALAQRSNARHQAAVAQVERTKAEQQEAIAKTNSKQSRNQAAIAKQQTKRARAAQKRAQVSERNAQAARSDALSQKAIAEGNRAKAVRLGALADAARNSAQKQASIADRERNNALRAKLTASAQALLGEDPEASVRQAIAGAAAFRGAGLRPGVALEDTLREGLLTLRLRAKLSGGGSVRVVRFSPDGSLVLIAGKGGARLFDRRHGLQSRRLRPVTALADADFSPDGRFVAGAGTGTNYTVQVWDVQTGIPVFTLHHEGPVLSVAFSPNGRFIGTGSVDGTARLWNAANGQSLAVFRHPSGVSRGDDVQMVSFSPDSTRFLTVGGDRFARLFDVSRPEKDPILLNHRDQVNTARFSPSGRTIATGGANNFVRIWDASTGDPKFELEGGGRISDLAFSPDDSLLATAGGNDTTARVWNLERRTSVAIITAHKSGVESVTFSPDGRSVVTTGRDGKGYIIRTESGFTQGLLVGHHGPVNASAFSPDGQLVATASDDGSARLWDATVDPNGPLPRADARAIGNHVLPATARRGPFVAFSPDGRRILSAGADGTARLWGPGNGMVSLQHGGPVNTGFFSRDGKTVITASDDGSARLWSVAGGHALSTLEHGAPVNVARLSPNGRLAVTAGRDGVALIWDVRRGTRLQRLETGSPVNDASFSPDGQLVATAGADGVAAIWRVSDGRRLSVLRGHTGAIVALVFTRDGKRLGTASADSTARIWDVRSGASTELRGHTSGLTSLAFNPDGSLLATASIDADARVWNARSGKEVAVLRIHVGSVNDIAFSADGRWLATAGPQAAGIWETRKTGAWPALPIYLVRAPPPRLDHLAFSSHGWRLVMGWRDGAIRTYDCRLCGGIKQLTGIGRARLREIVKR
jgi:WD40 repeat protein